MKKACIAVVGAGGKTTAVRCLAHRLSGFSVLWTTTTHIYPPAAGDCRLLLENPTAARLREALGQPGVVGAGVPDGEKWTALPPDVLAAGRRAADYILCEADGSRQLPLKLHRPDEPVLPAGTTHCLIVVGMAALGQPVGKAVHRYERNPDWALHPDTMVGVEALRYCAREAVACCALPKKRIRLLFHQADSPDRRFIGEMAARMMTREGISCRVGALQQDDAFLLPWVLEG